ncbi:hypothetical protein O6R08_00050 [Cutibacterium equinum]|uniref:Bacterial type II secretion system protein F domain protein n=1 Tax=Cutibacterium equinum TaxID=3016342 RepID=A0ABY7QY86_9ACTN|nr:hypothetical protein [Cutibacterium equinum]WCC80004.1 hypothetical protein O6R08_00050 [Cutibacterium equinum]
MIESTLVLAAICGALLASAPLFVIAGRRGAPLRLSDALAGLSGRTRQDVVDPALPEGRLERWGARAAARWPLLVSEKSRRTLALQGRTPGDVVAEKAVMAVGGMTIPILARVVAAIWGDTLPVTPVGLAVVLAVVGWFLPDIRVRSRSESVRQDAAEAVLVYIDLVTLARLANQSVPRALVEAAHMSDHPVLARIRTTLERSRLEQQSPWAGLEHLAEDLGLPELAELVEVLRLDDQGASLAATLRARVNEMRDAHLNREKVEAHATSESLTIWMVIPVLVLGLVLVTPPLLIMAGVAS